MSIKQGPYGRFYGCTNYPECKTTEPITAKAPCPNCGNTLVERYSKKRRQTFWGCSQFPICNFTSNEEPVAACPDCEEGVLIVKDDETLACINKNCGHTQPIPTEAESEAPKEVTAST